MGSSATNAVSLAVARESSIGTLPGSPEWFALEFEDISDLGVQPTKVARTPVSLDRGRKKGKVVGQESAFTIENDLTGDMLERFGEPMFACEWANSEFNLRSSSGTLPPPAVDGGGSNDSFTIDAASTELAAKMAWTSGEAITLIYAKGYTNAENNGLFPLAADVGATDTSVQVATGTLVAETPPTNASLQVAGLRTEDVTVTVNADGTGSLVSAAHVSDWSTYGLQAGMFIHIGGINTSTELVANAPSIGGTDRYGYVRVTSISGGTLNFDKATEGLDKANNGSSGGSETVDILFGRFARSVRVTADSDDNRYQELYHRFEVGFDNLGSGGATEYEYPTGQMLNTVSIESALEDKTTMTLGFVGTDTPAPTSTRATNASSAKEPLRTNAFATSLDMASISTDLISSDSDVCFQTFNWTISNNVETESCLAKFAKFSVTPGQFTVDISGEMMFTTAAILSAIRSNTTVTMAQIFRNEDGAAAFDFPEMTLGDGGRSFPRNQTVKVSITGETHTSATFGYDASLSLLPVAPRHPVAAAV